MRGTRTLLLLAALAVLGCDTEKRRLYLCDRSRGYLAEIQQCRDDAGCAISTDDLRWERTQRQRLIDGRCDEPYEKEDD